MIGGSAGSRSSVDRRARLRCLRRGRRLAAHRVEIGGRQLETDRPREVEHFVDDAVQPRDLFVDVRRPPRALAPASTSGRRSVCSDALMIISGLRISCAMTVDSRPSDDSRSLCDISRWKRAIESVSVLNVVASSRASSSSQRSAVAQRDLARQVAGRGHVAHHAGDGGQRPGDRAGDGVAEQRRQQHGDDRRRRQAGVDRVQEPQLLGARAQDQGDRSGRRPSCRRRGERPRQRDVLLRRRSHAARATVRGADARPALAYARAAASPRESVRPCRTRCRCR